MCCCCPQVVSRGGAVLHRWLCWESPRRWRLGLRWCSQMKSGSPETHTTHTHTWLWLNILDAHRLTRFRFNSNLPFSLQRCMYSSLLVTYNFLYEWIPWLLFNSLIRFIIYYYSSEKCQKIVKTNTHHNFPEPTVTNLNCMLVQATIKKQKRLNFNKGKERKAANLTFVKLNQYFCLITDWNN